MRYARQRWWYPASWAYRWVLFRGCWNFDRHHTWRQA